MTKTWAIARHMIAEGIRMKIALVFLVLIGMVVVGLPFSVTGDGSLTGAVQSFMSYALSATAVLLGMLTIFMSRSLADELVQCQIFLVMTKPVARWQYILGKWLGITVLNAAFVACAGLTIYGMVHYIRLTHVPLGRQFVAPGSSGAAAKEEDGESEAGGARAWQTFDEAQLEHEVLVARHALKCKLPDFTRPALQEFERNLEEGLYANTPDLDPRAEKARLARKYEARWRVVGPLEKRIFEFENVLCDRSPGQAVQLRYKTDVSQPPLDDVFRAFWQFGDLAKGTKTYNLKARHVVGRFHTIAVAADAVAEDHTFVAYFSNENPFTVQGEDQSPNVIDFRKSNGVELLFVVGSFEGNLIRLLLLLMCKLMFLAAVALLMTTVFSFPVACLASFTFYVLAALQPFLAETWDTVVFDYSWAANLWSKLQLKTVLWLIVGNLSRYDAVESFVNGRNVSLVWVIQAVAELALVRSAVLLGVAMLLFERREVAEVSV